MDYSILEDLGLTISEIKTYVAILEIGSTTAGAILEKSELQNSVVHRAINSLIEKGLVSYILEGRIKKYQATDPENFNNYIEDKKQRFQQVLPELKAKQSLAKEKETATIYRGIRGLTEIYTTLVNQKGEYNTFGGGYPCVQRMGTTWWSNIHAKRIANKLRGRQVFDETVRKDTKKVTQKMTEVKFLDKSFAQFQETVISGDYVAINVFTEKPYGFLIHDKQVADVYRKYFELLWKTAK